MRQNFAAFSPETKVCNLLAKIREFRSYWRSSAHTSHLHSTVRCISAALLPGQGILRLEKNKRIELDIDIDEVFIKLFPWKPRDWLWSRLIKGLKSCPSLRLQRSKAPLLISSCLPIIEKTRFSLHICYTSGFEHALKSYYLFFVYTVVLCSDC